MKLYRFISALYIVSLSYSAQASDNFKDENTPDSTQANTVQLAVEDGVKVKNLQESTQNALNESSQSLKPLSKNVIKQETIPENNFGSWGVWFSNAKFSWMSNPKIEEKKFPSMTLSNLIEFAKEKGGILEGYMFSYSTGSEKGASDYYEGLAKIQYVKCGKLQYSCTDAQKLNSPDVTFIETSESNIIKFTKNWTNSSFYKGAPYKNDHTGKTLCDYTVYDENRLHCIKFKIERNADKK